MKKNQGFTLIEVMIVVAIVAIIAAIAIPSYNQYVVRSKRADAMGTLMSATQAVERYKSNNNFSYAGADTANVIPTQVPSDGGDAYYTIAFQAAPTVTTYTLVATPTGSQPASDGTLTINEKGEKTWNGNSCWPESGSSC
ncbi:type IV pilin protein [Kangiella taiwanensis]|uniref:Type IV pilin protein n=1 Tax=Kangiella taiwanensis TaxID=1079179 RepID=A0ABP8I020_9GAMM|nr:type IV pilin protein [Kangiella taiwanensis]